MPETLIKLMNVIAAYFAVISDEHECHAKHKIFMGLYTFVEQSGYGFNILIRSLIMWYYCSGINDC